MHECFALFFATATTRVSTQASFAISAVNCWSSSCHPLRRANSAATKLPPAPYSRSIVMILNISILQPYPSYRIRRTFFYPETV